VRIRCRCFDSVAGEVYRVLGPLIRVFSALGSARVDPSGGGGGKLNLGFSILGTAFFNYSRYKCSMLCFLIHGKTFVIRTPVALCSEPSYAQAHRRRQPISSRTSHVSVISIGQQIAASYQRRYVLTPVSVISIFAFCYSLFWAAEIFTDENRDSNIIFSKGSGHCCN
jgi:hypothetical protein